MNAEGLLSVCVQHEIDHLDGKTILDRKYIPETLRVEKIGRNQKVVISDGSEAKTIKYKKAQKLLVQSNKKFPNKANTLNYLGFTTRKLGDYENGEKYYLKGLQIDPKHKGINEYLGELYVATNRHNLAIERLEVLKGCNCREYDDLKAIIAGEKVSKY